MVSTRAARRAMESASREDGEDGGEQAPSSGRKAGAFTVGMADEASPAVASPEAPPSSGRKAVAFTVGMADEASPAVASPAQPTPEAPPSSGRKAVAFTVGMADEASPAVASPAQPTPEAPPSSGRKAVAFTGGMGDEASPAVASPAQPTPEAPPSSGRKAVAFTGGMGDEASPAVASPAQPTPEAPPSSGRKAVAFTVGMADEASPAVASPAQPTPEAPPSSGRKAVAFTVGMGDEPSPAQPTPEAPPSSGRKAVAFTVGMADEPTPPAASPAASMPAPPTPEAPPSSGRKAVAFTVGDEPDVPPPSNSPQPEASPAPPTPEAPEASSPAQQSASPAPQANATTPTATLPLPVDEIKVESHRVVLDPDEDGSYPEEVTSPISPSPIKEYVPRGKLGKSVMERKLETLAQEHSRELEVKTHISRFEEERILFDGEKMPRKCPAPPSHENIFGASFAESLTKKMSALEIAKAKAAKEMPRPGKPKVLKNESEVLVLQKHESALEREVAAARAAQPARTKPDRAGADDIFSGTFLSSLKVHRSNFEEEVAAAKAASAASPNAAKRSVQRPSSAVVQHAEGWQGAGMDLTKHKSRLELEKEAARAAQGNSRKPNHQQRPRTADLGSWGAGLADVTVKHKSALELMKENARDLPRTPVKTPNAKVGTGAGTSDWGLVRPKSALERAKEAAFESPFRKVKKLSPNSRMMAEWEGEAFGQQPVKKTELELDKEAWRLAEQKAQKEAQRRRIFARH